MGERKVFNKKSPSENKATFIPLPSNALHYVHHDRISAEKLLLYGLIIDYYNVEEGFAFPSIEKLAVRYGKSPDTTSRHLDDLKAVGLIDFPEKGHYVPLTPLSEDEFYTEYPGANENYRKALSRCNKRRADAAERMRKWRQEKGYADN
ncbi:hypothetical protein BC6307_19380 [Sutcliffiella cohnii]|uniref:Helix-turn-helix domain-containing protein n=1 Tax=Sutcliffiella cohnii TaxID=33932 RepID=A0A223KUW3_9BACI|nr:helix-turn-helix domain-containing protein [Sutcliffiella cohnii]AST93265.1 hypothetical protein BC6307_19380 [Sutcliffiella cohnii]